MNTFQKLNEVRKTMSLKAIYPSKMGFWEMYILMKLFRVECSVFGVKKHYLRSLKVVHKTIVKIKLSVKNPEDDISNIIEEKLSDVLPEYLIKKITDWIKPIIKENYNKAKEYAINKLSQDSIIKE